MFMYIYYSRVEASKFSKIEVNVFWATSVLEVDGDRVSDVRIWRWWWWCTGLWPLFWICGRFLVIRRWCGALWLFQCVTPIWREIAGLIRRQGNISNYSTFCKQKKSTHQSQFIRHCEMPIFGKILLTWEVFKALHKMH